MTLLEGVVDRTTMRAGGRDKVTPQECFDEIAKIALSECELVDCTIPQFVAGLDEIIFTLSGAREIAEQCLRATEGKPDRSQEDTREVPRLGRRARDETQVLPRQFEEPPDGP